jgi:hypothetical protein
VAYYLMSDNRRRMPSSAYLRAELTEAHTPPHAYPSGDHVRRILIGTSTYVNACAPGLQHGNQQETSNEYSRRYAIGSWHEVT